MTVLGEVRIRELGPRLTRFARPNQTQSERVPRCEGRVMHQGAPAALCSLFHLARFPFRCT